MENLQGYIERIKALQDETREREKVLTGHEIAARDLRQQLTRASLTGEEKVTKQAAYEAETQKIANSQAESEDTWSRLAAALKARNELYDKMNTRPMEAESLDSSHLSQTTPVKPYGVQGGQLTSLALFTGAGDGETWLRQVDRAQVQFGWTDKQTAIAARSKLQGDALLYIDNQEDEDLPGIDAWKEGDSNLRKMLFARFSLSLSEATASHALDDLSQKAHETVDQLFDRVRYAVNKFLYNFDDKTTENYKAIYKRLLFMHFKTAMNPSYRQAIFSAVHGQQPQNPLSLLEAARNAEQEAGKSKRDHLKKNVNELSTSQDKSPEQKTKTDTGENSKEPTLESLAREVDAIQRQWATRGRGRGARGRGGRGRGAPGGRGGGGRGGPPTGSYTCYNCGGKGHWRKHCPSTKDNNQLYYPPSGPPNQHQRPQPQQHQQHQQGQQQPPQWGRQANELSFQESLEGDLNY